MKIIKMRYSIEARDTIYVKGYGFLSFAKNMAKNFSYKYGQNLDSAKKSTIKAALKRAIQKTAEATSDLIGNKIADKMTSVSKKPAMELHNNDETEEDVEKATPKKRYISPEERQQIIDELRLVPKKDAYF